MDDDDDDDDFSSLFVVVVVFGVGVVVDLFLSLFDGDVSVVFFIIDDELIDAFPTSVSSF